MKRQVFVIHGGECFETQEAFLSTIKTWTMTLADLTKQGWSKTLGQALPDFDVYRPQMPNSLNARYDAWKIWFEKFVPEMRDDVVLIGHSLGGIFLAKFLAENDLGKRISSLHLVATPFDPHASGYLADFVLPESLQKVSAQVSAICIYASTDDTVVPFSDAESYAKVWPSAKLVQFSDRGHFNQETFPELIANIH